MSDTAHHAGDIETENRYGVIDAGDGSVIVYDRREPDAWIQSDYTVDLGAE